MAGSANDIVQEWKTNLEVTKKAKYLRELDQIKFQFKNVERELSLQLHSKRGDNKQIYQELEHMDSVLTQELKTERLKIDQHLSKMREKVQRFQGQLGSVDPISEFVERIKEAMEDIESTVNIFKEQQSNMFETLINEEHATERDVEIIQKRLQAMSQTENASSTKGSSFVSKQSDSSNLPPEISAFEKYLSQFGAQGGWDDYDHGTFLKIRNKFKGKSTFIMSAVENIPGRLEDDIKEHERWYKKFIELQAAKKLAIAEWKLKKAQEAKENASAEAISREMERQEILSRERREKEEAERELKKKQLEQWKIKKAEKDRLEAERLEKEEMKKKKLKEKEHMAMKEIREEARLRLQEKKEEKERNKWRMESEQEELRSARGEQALMEITRFQSRDRMKLNSRQEEKRRKEEEERLRKQRLEKVKREVQVTAVADRNRLYRPTDAWIQRQKQMKSGTTRQTSVASMPHRAVPTWRQGM